MTIEDRYYQRNAVDALWHYFEKETGNPVLALPTGTGKSVVIARFVQEAFRAYPQTRLIMATHVKELVAQNLEKLLRMWPTAPAGVYSAGLNRKEIAPIVFGSIDSMYRKAADFGPRDIVIIDEAHLVPPSSDTKYQRFLSDLMDVNPRLKIVGLTATSYRLGLGSITNNGIFTDIAYDITQRESFNKLVREGFIARLLPKQARTEIDTADVATRGGEFVEKQLQEAADKEAITRAAVTEIVDTGYRENRSTWIIFTTGIAHTEHVTEMLRDAFGIRAAAVHSKMPSATRDANIAALQRGDITALVNSNILTTGFDCAKIDLLAVLRPTKSPVLWVQMLGRGTRPSPGKTDCLVLDFAGNTRRLGPINDPVLPKPKRKGGGGGTAGAPVRLCDVCAYYSHASLRHCEHCGTEFPQVVRYGASADTLALIAGDDVPKIETFKVEQVTYHNRIRPGKPNALKVCYFCGLALFNEWVCLDHDKFALQRAHSWWRKRSHLDPPSSVSAAMPHVHTLRVPTHIRVWVNKKHPDILSHAFNGVFDDAANPTAPAPSGG